MYFGPAGRNPIKFFERLEGIPKRVSGYSVSEYLLEVLSFNDSVDFVQHYERSELAAKNREEVDKTTTYEINVNNGNDQEDKQFERTLFGELLFDSIQILRPLVTFIVLVFESYHLRTF